MDTVDRIRAFNRFYTRQIGVLNASFLNSDMTLTEVRVLHDIDASGGSATARGLCRALALDEGYLSRLLGRFEADGLLARTPDPDDARRRLLGLTDAGKARLAPLTAASRKAVADSVAHLSAIDCTRLLASMQNISAMLGSGDAPDPASVKLRDLNPGDIGWVIQRHGELYARDESFDDTFEALVARILVDFMDSQTENPVDRGWIAEGPDGQRLGCVFCVRLDRTTAKLRLFLVEPGARGLGLGVRLLHACLDHARETGHQRLALWTHKSHEAACALYAKSGFRIVGEKPVHSFGRDLVELSWEIDL